MAQLQHLPATADPATITATVERDGAVILDDVLSPEFLVALRGETRSTPFFPALGRRVKPAISGGEGFKHPEPCAFALPLVQLRLVG
jgi:hypothetical protein